MLARIKLIFFLILLFCVKPLFSDTTPATLQVLEIKQRQTQTVLIFTLKNSTQPHFFTLQNPDRFVLDLPNTKSSSVLPTDIHSKGLIQRIRLGNGPNGAGNLRLVMDLKAPAQYVLRVDQNAQKTGIKITVILTKQAGAAPTQKTETEPSDLEELEQQQSVNKAIGPLATGKANLIQPAKQDYTAIKNSPMNKVIVMLDPGHGGKDSGAIGANKHMEKTVVLAIGKKLQALLNQEPGMDARLTRKGDYFISLRQRLNIARQNHAQLFVAIHADAFNETATGASVFALSPHGATSEAARWLADRENTSELSGIDLKVKDKELKSVLLDMSQTATIEDSLQLGRDMLSSLSGLTRLHSEHVEQAGFVVLKSPDIPSVLVETGFISNPTEEARLITPEYQDKVAEALAKGIVAYFKQNPPPGSWFEMEYKNS